MTLRAAVIAGLLLFPLTAVVLLAMGRPPLCPCGTVLLWTPADNVAESSQHIADWYAPSHVVHGLLFYFGLWLVLRSRPRPELGFYALAIEAAWEILENTPIVIERYREATLAMGYAGDSVINSLFDLVWTVFGILIAMRAPVWLSVTLAIALELVALWAIRDNLALNVLMLLWPIEAIKAWQLGAPG
ncbi:DUF2585 domain-containing protein [Polymorphum gilvum]|uniref:Uncharacterized protein n=1 Tax=Polymorphum gilvum (strain LMG 25793 / CGMCC 1.9160 / SL003B-26A1) TaxID=991905 RepID=F2IWB9_POLGS|nr:DUF2585 domain-containing protein [Polymorphum gilvum]ADZ71504.1 hypothetical protein SL003B_3081 [Polymorphum gilvum SL003B-26A1]